LPIEGRKRRAPGRKVGDGLSFGRRAHSEEGLKRGREREGSWGVIADIKERRGSEVLKNAHPKAVPHT